MACPGGVIFLILTTNGFRPTLPSGKDNERRRQRRFQLCSATTLHIRSSRSTQAQCIFFLRSALGAECLSTPQIASTKETQEGKVKCPSSTREDTNSQRPTHLIPITFRRNVDFLTNNVDLRMCDTHDDCLSKRNERLQNRE